jgi:hypothetical protein
MPRIIGSLLVGVKDVGKFTTILYIPAVRLESVFSTVL